MVTLEGGLVDADVASFGSPRAGAVSFERDPVDGPSVLSAPSAVLTFS